MANRRKPKLPTNDVVRAEVRQFQPLNKEQAELVKTIHQKSIVLVDGIAGAGKTFCACAVGCEYLLRGIVDKLVISRPCVTAHEDLGFIPGSISDKFSPFLQPLYTELSYFINVEREIDAGRVIIQPISFMRGITLKSCFYICDEIQNITYHQAKLILTRYGGNSKFVFCGDSGQSDLEGKSQHDFVKLKEKLYKIAGPDDEIAIVTLKHSVRHPLVEKVLKVLD